MKRRMLFLLALLVIGGITPAQAQDAQPTRGILIIPAIDLAKYIQIAPVILVDGQRVNDVSWLGEGVAWLAGTGWVDTPHWRMALAGHNPGAFARLDELHIGDSIYVLTSAGLARYVVSDVSTVYSEAIWILNTTEKPSLVLITCAGARRLAVIALRS